MMKMMMVQSCLTTHNAPTPQPHPAPSRPESPSKTIFHPFSAAPVFMTHALISIPPLTLHTHLCIQFSSENTHKQFVVNKLSPHLMCVLREGVNKTVL